MLRWLYFYYFTSAHCCSRSDFSSIILFISRRDISSKLCSVSPTTTKTVSYDKKLTDSIADFKSIPSVVSKYVLLASCLTELDTSRKWYEIMSDGCVAGCCLSVSEIFVNWLPNDLLVFVNLVNLLHN